MDGFEAARIIREEIGTAYAKTIPIIALTANAIIGNEDLFLKNGFQAFLSKPIDIIQLDLIVSRYVRNKDTEKELGLTGKKPASQDRETENSLSAEKQSSNEERASIMAGRSLEGIDLNSGLKRFDGNEETYLGIVSSYFAQIETTLGKIRACTSENWPLEEGWSSKEADLQKKTLDEYRILVHSLKGTSYTIGARHIGSMAEELEKAAFSEDMKFINANNGSLIESLEKLIPVLKDFLDEIQNANQKPLRGAPDPALLAGLLEACANYNMEQMDAIMNELEQYRYTSRADLVKWLRKELNKSELESMRECLSSLNI
jgi:CheY-like chemotaxis protein